jgi:hypothetical protein
LRHCGLVAELCLFAGDEEFAAAAAPTARKALAYILRRTTTASTRSLAWIEGKRWIKLGAAALAAHAWLRAPATVECDASETLTRVLDYLVEQQHHDGRFNSKVCKVTAAEQPFVSEYYPSQAVLALTEGTAHTGNSTYLHHALIGLRWIVANSPATIAPNGAFRGHWEAQALTAMHRMEPAPIWIARARIIAAETLAKPPGIPPVALGRLSTAEVATRLECLAALYALGEEAFKPSELATMRETVLDGARILMDRQLVAGSPWQAMAIGGFVAGERNRTIRIDCVQHSMSALRSAQRLFEEAAPRTTSPQSNPARPHPRRPSAAAPGAWASSPLLSASPTPVPKSAAGTGPSPTPPPPQSPPAAPRR